MATLKIEGSFYRLGEDGPIDYDAKVTLQETLVLTALAPVTLNPNYGHSPKPPADAALGGWMSSSIYLGKELTGRFYVTIVNFPEPGQWKELVNPAGLFFDSTSEDDPFLTLYDFQPTSKSLRKSRARGKLINKRSDLGNTWVDWYPYFG